VFWVICVEFGGFGQNCTVFGVGIRQFSLCDWFWIDFPVLGAGFLKLCEFWCFDFVFLLARTWNLAFSETSGVWCFWVSCGGLLILAGILWCLGLCKPVFVNLSFWLLFFD